MIGLLDLGLTNAVLATLLALLAAAATVVCRRPALVHGLWLLVLLKLITPPLFYVPIPDSWAAQPVTETATEATPPVAEEDPPAIVADGPMPSEDLAPIAVPEIEQPAVDVPSSIGPAEAAPVWASISWRAVAAGLWLAGSGLWFLVVGLRIWRFHRLLRYAQPAPVELETLAESVAMRLGLEDAPRVWLVPGAVSPMLWTLGRQPRLLLPSQLLDHLDANQQATLLAHEMAHWRRGDHWVRFVELLVSGLYWWHPVAWWARAQLREAEERCCDAWVVWALPGEARAYATALLTTVALFSEERMTLPVAASGIGYIRHLRRRVTMIMQGNTPPGLSRTGLLTVLGLGLLILPLVPAWGQQQSDKQRQEAQEQQRRAEEQERRAREERDRAEQNERRARQEFERGRQRAEEEQQAQRQPGERGRTPPVDDMRRRVEMLTAELEHTKARLEQITTELKRAHEQLAEADRQRGGPGDRPQGPRPSTGSGFGFSAGGSGGGVPGPGGPGAGPSGMPGGPPGFGGFGGGGGSRGGFGGGGFARSGSSSAEQDRRLKEVEDKLDRLLDEVRNLRRDQRPQPGPATAPRGNTRRPGGEGGEPPATPRPPDRRPPTPPAPPNPPNAPGTPAVPPAASAPAQPSLEPVAPAQPARTAIRQ